eukprot:915817-Rhodomonas_salina.3
MHCAATTECPPRYEDSFLLEIYPAYFHVGIPTRVLITVTLKTGNRSRSCHNARDHWSQFSVCRFSDAAALGVTVPGPAGYRVPGYSGTVVGIHAVTSLGTSLTAVNLSPGP